jgi:hypothetical protein
MGKYFALVTDSERGILLQAGVEKLAYQFCLRRPFDCVRVRKSIGREVWLVSERSMRR